MADDQELFDTHCHIHEAWRSVGHGMLYSPADVVQDASLVSTKNQNVGFLGADATAKLWDKAGRPDADDIIARAVDAGVTRMVCVGTTLPDSKLAIKFVASRDHTWASIGLHPHEAKTYAGDKKLLAEFAALAAQSKVIAVGECGLDYFYNHSPRAEQAEILRFQIELALARDLPMIFHVREAFADFWPIFDSYKGVRGVIHSFSAGREELEQILQRNLFVGLNGIMTFTRNPEQLAAAKIVPSNRLLLETDAPFLTPHPYRGSICEPKHVRATCEFLAGLRGVTPKELSQQTTANARNLFSV